MKSQSQLEIEHLRTHFLSLRQTVDTMDQFLERYIEIEQALRDSEDLFQLLVDGVRDYAIFLLDPQGFVTTWNIGAEQIKGYQADEIIGSHFSVFFTPQDLANDKPKYELEIATTAGRYEEEGWRVRKDGTPFWAYVVISALYDHDGVLRGFGKITRDMTDQKRAEEQREELRLRELQLQREQDARLQTERLMKLHDEFLIFAAHEIRTPLTTLLGNTQLLQRRAKRGKVLTERDENNLQVVIQQVRRLNRLVLTLMDLSRVQNDQLSIETQPLNLSLVVEHIVNETGPTLRQHELVYTCTEEPIWVMGDELRLEQVLYNLLQNAIKYSPLGGTIGIALDQHDNHAYLSVSDQGIGIPSASLPHLFERFFRASNVGAQSISGLGVGLFVVKNVIERHEGSIAVTSEEGRGSTFTITLPLLEPVPDNHSHDISVAG